MAGENERWYGFKASTLMTREKGAFMWISKGLEYFRVVAERLSSAGVLQYEGTRSFRTALTYKHAGCIIQLNRQVCCNCNLLSGASEKRIQGQRPEEMRNNRTSKMVFNSLYILSGL